MKSSIFFNLVYLVIFIVFLSMSSIGMYLRITSNTEETEWRKLTEFPKVNAEMEISKFPKKFEQFYNDNFGFRDFLLHIDATIKKSLLKVPVQNEIAGKMNWFFFNEAKDSYHDFKSFYSHIIFSNQELNRIANVLQADKDWLAQKNIPYLFVIVPDKEVVYPEFYPYPNYINSNIQLAQILDVLDRKTSVSYLYLGPQLIAAKKIVDAPLYFKYDNHWNHMGAFFGYQAVINKIKKDFPYNESLQLSDFNLSIVKQSGAEKFDLNRLRSLLEDNATGDVDIDLHIKDSAIEGINKINKALILDDSFFGNASYENIGGSIHFLKYNFNKIISIENPFSALDRSQVEKEQPDIVIRETIQRNAYRLIVL